MRKVRSRDARDVARTGGRAALVWPWYLLLVLAVLAVLAMLAMLTTLQAPPCKRSMTRPFVHPHVRTFVLVLLALVITLAHRQVRISEPKRM